ncbi:MAG: helix-turn-helix transcriptional regulator [Gammaproteobacteria bacterium]|nr:helix-turn-helix transcriptional regulator [Gammaproteobacteria bacterium]
MSKKYDLIIPNNHISIASVIDINNICKPLFQHTDIDFFVFCRYYKDNSVMLLSSDLSFHEFLLSEIADKFFTWTALEAFIANTKKNTHNNIQQANWLVKNTTTYQLQSCFLNRFKIGNGIEIAEKYENHYDVFWFDSKTNDRLTDFYFEHFDILEQFILYFYSQAATLINRNERHKIIVPTRNSGYENFVQEAANKMYENNAGLTDLQKKLALTRYPMRHNGKITNLSAKEFNCLHYLARGYSQKEIGRTCGISDRTVESHLDKIKGKLNIYNKKELIELFYASRLARLKVTDQNQ